MKASVMMFAPTISERGDDDGAEGVRQDVPEDDPAVADAHGPRRFHEDLLAQRQEKASHERARPSQPRSAKTRMIESQPPPPRNFDDDEDDEQERQREHDVDDPHEAVVR